MARPLHVPLMAGCYASQPREYTFKNWFVCRLQPIAFVGRELDRLKCDVLDQPLEIFGNIDTRAPQDLASPGLRFFETPLCR